MPAWPSSAGRPGLSSPLPEAGPDHAGAVPDDLVVQRKVGFEFETPWRARKVSTGKSLATRELIGTAFDGFKVEADADPSGGHSEIEFIVDPPVEEGEAGKRRHEGDAGRDPHRRANVVCLPESRLQRT